uniref:DC1 domain-containing protein n=1 Tax=Leersia perrieri TaxID=77586 RepID=A0A0D9X1D4_9ORYZ
MASPATNYLTESRTHFAHPQHPLLKTQYGDGDQPQLNHVCHICGTRVTNGAAAGYRCSIDHCDFHIHSACADFFQETATTPPPNLFGHPWSHNLALRPILLPAPAAANVGGAGGLFIWPPSCRLCRGPLVHGHLAYECRPRRCRFVVHPLCTMLPGQIRCPLLHHREDHKLTDSELIAISAQSTTGPRSATTDHQRVVCAVCRQDFSAGRTRQRHYRCGVCEFALHIGGCASGVPQPPLPWDGGDAAAAAVARFLVVVAEQQLAVDFPGDGMADVINALRVSLGSGDY